MVREKDLETRKKMNVNGNARNIKMDEKGVHSKIIFSGKRFPKILGRYSPKKNEQKNSPKAVMMIQNIVKKSVD